MGEFVVESMSDISSMRLSSWGLTSSDDFNIAHFQEQVGRFLLHSKKFLLCDIVDPDSMEGKVASTIKYSIYEGIRNNTFAKNNCMKHFLTLQELSYLSSHVAMLTLHSILKDYDIKSQEQEALRNALNPESVSIPMGFYVYVICMGNPKFQPSDFNIIFANSWIEYYESLMAKFFMIQMNGTSWKNHFAGCLFDN